MLLTKALFLIFAILLHCSVSYGQSISGGGRIGTGRTSQAFWFATLGDSNCVGQSNETRLDMSMSDSGLRNTAYTSYEHYNGGPTYSEASKPLRDPFLPNSQGGSRKSVWPTLAKWIIYYTDRPVNFIFGCYPGGALIYAPPNDTKGFYGYDNLLTRVTGVLPAGESLDAVLYQGGYWDYRYYVGDDATTHAAYETAISDMADDVWADYGAPLFVWKPSFVLNEDITEGRTNAIHTAIDHAVATNAHLYAGPVTEGLGWMGVADPNHIKSMGALASRWKDILLESGVVSNRYE